MIYLTHGVLPRKSAACISHTLLQSETQFSLHLQHRQTKYVSLQEAIAGNGDALTVDDATYGALDAALLARRSGHEVTWFVNCEHVQSGLEYFPYQCSVMVDQCTRSFCDFEGRLWDLSSGLGKRALRLELKRLYMRLCNFADIQQLLSKATYSLGIEQIQLERALSVVKQNDLHEAYLNGVDLQNHGWNHLNPRVLSDTRRIAEIQQNEEYLSRLRRTKVRYYAPPFGSHVDLGCNLIDCVLLADHSKTWLPGAYDIVNRGDLFPIERPLH